jgi:hypothetical protein
VVWIDTVGIQEMAKYGPLSGVNLGPLYIVQFAEALVAKGLISVRLDGVCPSNVFTDVCDEHIVYR